MKDLVEYHCRIETDSIDETITGSTAEAHVSVDVTAADALAIGGVLGHNDNPLAIAPGACPPASHATAQMPPPPLGGPPGGQPAGNLPGGNAPNGKGGDGKGGKGGAKEKSKAAAKAAELAIPLEMTDPAKDAYIWMRWIGNDAVEMHRLASPVAKLYNGKIVCGWLSRWICFG